MVSYGELRGYSLHGFVFVILSSISRLLKFPTSFVLKMHWVYSIN